MSGAGCRARGRREKKDEVFGDGDHWRSVAHFLLRRSALCTLESVTHFLLRRSALCTLEGVTYTHPRKVRIRLLGKGDSHSHGARPVY